MRVVLSLCSYKHVFNGLRRVAMEGNDRDEFVDMTFDSVSNGKSLEVGVVRGVWPGRESGCRGCGPGEELAAGGVAWERGNLENGTVEGDWEGRFGGRLASFSGSPPTYQPHSPMVPIPYCK